jgi:hypothetical protein
MSIQPPSHCSLSPCRRPMMGLVALVALAVTGCQDGPMYALKVANPFYSWREWGADEKIGVTDHERRKQLSVLAETAGDLPPEKQQFWAGQLEKLIETDQSPEMRRLAVRAVSRMEVPNATAMIEQGLDDASLKVRMEACQALGRRPDEESTRLLVATIGTETDLDVRHAAMAALAQHDNSISRDALKMALSDRNPATRSLAIDSLKEVTGMNYGDDPQVWIAALNGQTVEAAEPTRLADRVREFF